MHGKRAAEHGAALQRRLLPDAGHGVRGHPGKDGGQQRHHQPCAPQHPESRQRHDGRHRQAAGKRLMERHET